jgi:hypothetical protein
MRAGVFALTSALVLGGCRSKTGDPAPSTASQSVVPVPSASATAAASGEPVPEPEEPRPNELDALFRGYRDKLPEPATLSEQNGASLKCEQHGWVTYTLLDATTEKLPVKSDEDVVRLARWARDRDVCVRQIALDALVKKVGYDPDRLVLPDMHEPDHYIYHDIFVSTLAYLERKRVRHSRKLFAGLMLDIRAQDFFKSMRGVWREEAKGKNFLRVVEVGADQLRATLARTEPDPARPEFTWTSKVKDVEVDARRRYVVKAEWSVESNNTGYQGKKIEPSDDVYEFWPVASDVVWFDDGPEEQWVKLRRVSK